MIYIQHRVNTKAQLEILDPSLGVEIDLRSDCGSGIIHLHHDPFERGEDFNTWLSLYASKKMAGPLILNTKEDGLEKKIIEICEQHNVANFFFLDTALPTLVKWALKLGEKRFASRLSVHEPIQLLESFKGKINWIWVDCFDGIPLDVSELQKVKKDFKICLVAPELQGVDRVHVGFTSLLEIADAICTKKPEEWRTRNY